MARSNGTLVTLNNKLYFVGGYNGGPKNEVWSSTDGITWTAEASLPFGLYNSSVVVF